jgi:4-amino-4-deoxy-L-arabinose transferase-like glycosyltransferase
MDRPQPWRWWLLLWLVGSLAFGFRYYYVLHAEVLQPVNEANVRADAVDYYNYARNLVDHGVFSKASPGTTPLIGDSYRDPGYPIFLAGWMKIFSQWGSWYAAVVLSQALLGAMTVVLMLLVGRHWMPTGWLVAAGVLMAVWPHNISMASYLLTETLFGFLCALSLFLLGIAHDRRSPGWAIAGGAGFSLAALTNAILLPFAPLLGLYMLIRRHMSRTMIACFTATALALVAPWLIRNAMLPSTESSSSGRALTNLVQGSWPIYFDAYQAASNPHLAARPEGALAAATITTINREVAVIEARPMTGLAMIWQRLTSHPGEYLCWYLSKPTLLWGWDIRMGQGDIYVYPTRHSPFNTNAAYMAVAAIAHIVNPLLFILMLVGCALALLPAQQAPSTLTATSLLLIFVTLVYSTLAAEPRYSVPFRGPEIMVATFALCRISARFAQLRSQTRSRHGHT